MKGTNKLIKGFVNRRERIDFLLTEDSLFLELEQGGLIRITSNIYGIGILGNNNLFKGTNEGKSISGVSNTIKGKNRL